MSAGVSRPRAQEAWLEREGVGPLAVAAREDGALMKAFGEAA